MTNSSSGNGLEVARAILKAISESSETNRVWGANKTEWTSHATKCVGEALREYSGRKWIAIHKDSEDNLQNRSEYLTIDVMGLDKINHGWGRPRVACELENKTHLEWNGYALWMHFRATGEHQSRTGLGYSHAFPLSGCHLNCNRSGPRFERGPRRDTLGA